MKTDTYWNRASKTCLAFQTKTCFSIRRVLNTTGTCLCHTDCCNIHTPLLELSAFGCMKHSADFCLLPKHFKIFRSFWHLFISLCLCNRTPALLPRVTSHKFKGTVTALKREEMLSAAAKQTWVTGRMTGALLNTIAMKPHHGPESSLGMHPQNTCSEGNTALEGKNFHPPASHAKIKEDSLLEICRVGWPHS